MDMFANWKNQISLGSVCHTVVFMQGSTGRSAEGGNTGQIPKRFLVISTILLSFAMCRIIGKSSVTAVFFPQNAAALKQ